MMFSPLITTRLMLRPVNREDAQDMFVYRSLPEVYRYQNFEPEHMDDILNFINSFCHETPDTDGTWFQMAITVKDSGQMIGDCGIHFPEGDKLQAEIGITLAPEHQKKGLASETLTAVFGYLFDTLGKHRVYASIDPENRASIKLMERMGMQKEAHFRQSIRFKGKWADDVIFAILEHEWYERKGVGTEKYGG